MATNNGQYFTGYGFSVTIAGTTWPQSKSITITPPKYNVVDVQALSGLKRVKDGCTDFGTLAVIVPQDGSAALDSTIELTGSATNGTRTCTFKGYLTEDGGGTLQRGQTCDRSIGLSLTELPVWS